MFFFYFYQDKYQNITNCVYLSYCIGTYQYQSVLYYKNIKFSKMVYCNRYTKQQENDIDKWHIILMCLINCSWYCVQIHFSSMYWRTYFKLLKMLIHQQAFLYKKYKETNIFHLITYLEKLSICILFYLSLCSFCSWLRFWMW